MRMIWLLVLAVLMAVCMVSGCGYKESTPKTRAVPPKAAAPSPKPAKGKPGPVVGIKSADLFSSPDMVDSKSSVSAGAKLLVFTVQGDKIEVSTPRGERGWLRRCVTCSPSEYKRRKTARQVPESLVCIGAEGEQLFMYGGAMSIGGNEPVAKVGQAFWMDPTAKGKRFTIGSTPNIGNPEVLLLLRSGGRVARLPIWRGS
ncbi:MAG: hypothetical protein Q7T82_13420 [Armatimonadota bacterium]|nr:hypothetical protein [Armatimonadota bacterium]